MLPSPVLNLVSRCSKYGLGIFVNGIDPQVDEGVVVVLFEFFEQFRSQILTVRMCRLFQLWHRVFLKYYSKAVEALLELLRATSLQNPLLVGHK